MDGKEGDTQALRNCSCDHCDYRQPHNCSVGGKMADERHTPDLIRLHEKTMTDTATDVANLRTDFIRETGEIKKGIHRIETQTLEKLVGGVAQEAARADATAKAAHSRIDLLDGKFKFLLSIFFGGGGVVAVGYILLQVFKGN